MIASILRGLLVPLTAAVLSACVSSPPADSSEFLAERDAARSYIVSDVAGQASAVAVDDIRNAGDADDRSLVDSYLADPAHARQLPARYQDYLIEVFDKDQIDAMTAWDGDPDAFAQQVEMHRFVLARSLSDWHVDNADPERSDVLQDHLITTLVAVIQTTPEPLIPPSQLSALGEDH